MKRRRRASPARRYELRLRAFRMVALLLENRRGLEVRELMEEIGISRAGIYRMRRAAELAGLTLASSDPAGSTGQLTRWTLVLPRQGRSPKYDDDFWRGTAIGTMPDERMARVLGVSQQLVQIARERLGIPAASKDTHVKRGPAPLLNWDRVPFGRRSDADLARELGVSQPAVSKRRRQLGIAPFRSEPDARKPRRPR